MFIEKHMFQHSFLIANFRVCFNTKLHKNIPNVDFMAILVKLATCHVRNAFKRPLRPNAPTVRVLTSVILKGIGWAFRKLYPTKIPGMVHQGLLAPQRLCDQMYPPMQYTEIFIAIENENFQQKMFDIFLFFCSKHRL